MPSAATETKKTQETPAQSGTTSQQQAGSSPQSTTTPARTQQESGNIATTSDQDIARRGIFGPSYFPSTAEFFTNPFGVMRRMHEEMDRAFAEAFGGRNASLERQGGTWAPAIDVGERDGNLVVHAELPGIRPEDVKLEVDNDTLVLSGSRQRSEEREERGIHRRERMYGSFYRAIPLPEGTDTDQARAQFNNGVLEITIPLPQRQSRARQIPINGS